MTRVFLLTETDCLAEDVVVIEPVSSFSEQGIFVILSRKQGA